MSFFETFEPDCDRIDHDLMTKGFHIIREPELIPLFQNAREQYMRSMAAAEIHAPKQRFHPRELVAAPWRKLTIGSSNGLAEGYAQLLQTTYFHVTPDSSGALEHLFLFLIKVRNALMRVSADFGFEPQRDGFWNASRVHHYPRGGGFMGAHRDTYFPLKLGDKPFYQVMALLGRKGTDFMTGGGYVVSRETGEKVDLESEGGFGAVVLFDGRTIHGVDDLDLDKILNFQAIDGRIAAFANVYVYQD